jgi:hypothetical protein
MFSQPSLFPHSMIRLEDVRLWVQPSRSVASLYLCCLTANRP